MRVVSLVPSLTETLFTFGLPSVDIVGRTPWCVHPMPAVGAVPVVGGTKTPRIQKIIQMRPDLVILDREENRRETYEELTGAGIRVFVSEVTALAEVPALLENLGREVGCTDIGRDFADRLRQRLAASMRGEQPDGSRPRVAALIWHSPLMALSPARYGGNLLGACGFDVADLSPGEGYPTVEPATLGAAGIGHLLLSSEPHPFTAAEGDEIADAVAACGFPRPVPVLVDGEALTWFGARSLAAVDYWQSLRWQLAHAPGPDSGAPG